MEGPSRSLWIASNGSSAISELGPIGSLFRRSIALGAGLERPRRSGSIRVLHRRNICSGEKRGLLVGKTKRGKGTKIMAVADRHGLPVALCTASASPAEVDLVQVTLEQRWVKEPPQRLIGDKAYDSDGLDAFLAEEYGTEMICPNRRNRRATQDGRPLRRYRRRWKIERLFAWLHNFRRLVVRWEYDPANYGAFLQLACIVILLRHL